MLSSKYRSKRRLVQLAVLFLIAAIPAFGLFRIDLTTASFNIMGSTVWWSNIFFVFGLLITFVSFPILIYTTLGTAWCGWACPQNLLTEWANTLTHKLLGKRASVDVNHEGVIARSKNKAQNWIILVSAFFVVSLVLSLIPFFVFFSPTEVWSFFTQNVNTTLSKFMQRLYAFTVLLVFIDIAAVRYFFCDYACAYRIGQKIFKSTEALHISYDATRSAECTKCNYCATACITSIEPTKISLYDNCIDCGECVDACNRLHAKSETFGLLSFQFGSKGGISAWQSKLRLVLASNLNRLLIAVLTVGIAMMAWGIHIQPPLIPKIPTKIQQQSLMVMRTCDNRCVQQHSACRPNNMYECYLAAACKCDCYLQLDPQNLSSGQWRQCAERNKTNANTLVTKKAL